MKFKFLSLLLVLFTTGATFAQDKPYTTEIGIQSDNDGFLATRSDRYYTAGNFGYYRHALKVSDNSSLQNKILGFELGQKIFNPQSGSIPDAIFVDRPFAGYLYLGTNLNLLYKNESNLKLQMRVGVIGQHAFGEEIQNVIHNTFGFYPLVGWEFQVRDAFQLNFSAEYNKLLTRGESADLSLVSHADLGTGFIGGGGGLMVRVGKFNQLFNSVSTSSTVTQNTKLKPLHTEELFVYYKPVLNLVGYDATIQGGIFETQAQPNEILTPLNPVVLTQQIGGCYVKGHWVFEASAIFQSRETSRMVKTHWGHQWGTLSGIYRF